MTRQKALGTALVLIILGLVAYAVCTMDTQNTQKGEGVFERLCSHGNFDGEWVDQDGNVRTIHAERDLNGDNSIQFIAGEHQRTACRHNFWVTTQEANERWTIHRVKQISMHAYLESPDGVMHYVNIYKDADGTTYLYFNKGESVWEKR